MLSYLDHYFHYSYGWLSLEYTLVFTCTFLISLECMPLLCKTCKLFLNPNTYTSA